MNKYRYSIIYVVYWYANICIYTHRLHDADSKAAGNAAANPLNRVRFASQLAQLSSMGFNNEALMTRFEGDDGKIVPDP